MLFFEVTAILKGLVEQSVVFNVSSKAQSSGLFEVTAILKAQSSKAWYLLCLARRISSFRSSASDSSGEPNISYILYETCAWTLNIIFSNYCNGIPGLANYEMPNEVC